MPAVNPAESHLFGARTAATGSRLSAEIAGLGHSPFAPSKRTSPSLLKRPRHARNEADDRSPAALAAASALGRCLCGGTPLAVRLGMRSGHRPQFDSVWHCGSRCLEITVRATVRREFRTDAVASTRVRHRVPLGLLLQTRGILSAGQLRQAESLAAVSGDDLATVLTGHFGVSERSITAATAAQWNAPVFTLPVAASADLLRLAPLPLFRTAASLPLRLVGSKLLLGSAAGVDSTLAFALERMHAVTVESGITPATGMERLWDSAATLTLRPAEEVACPDADSISRRVVRTVLQLRPVESRAVRVGRRLWLRLWLEPSALRGDPCHRDDIADFLFALPSPPAAATRS